jgi:hypothetical protein
MTKTVIESPAELYNMVGKTLGPSPSMEITQERINQFADVACCEIHARDHRSPRHRDGC